MIELVKYEVPSEGLTGVPNTFLDRFLPEANGEFVKMYLLLLQMATKARQEVSVPQLADRLNITESDVRRALKYWERMGQLQLAYDEGEELTRIAFPESRSTSKSVPQPTSQKRLDQDEEFIQLLYVVQKYLGKTLNSRELDVVGYWYQELHFPADVIEYMVEVCVANGHRSIRYIEKVALDWHERGMMTLARAKAYQQTYRSDYFKVMKAFGLNGRNPALPEQEMMERWLSEYGFDVEIVKEACNRTMAAIHEPSFPYADRILRDWKEAGVRTREDIRKLDEQRKQTTAGRGAARTQQGNPKNRFHNFEQRSYDYEALMKQINRQE